MSPSRFATNYRTSRRVLDYISEPSNADVDAVAVRKGKGLHSHTMPLQVELGLKKLLLIQTVRSYLAKSYSSLRIAASRRRRLNFLCAAPSFS
jgi:hypothetical protein